jgi:nucleotide-binding universal stress UspA family protein
MEMLLHIQTYPEPLPTAAVDRAIEAAELWGGRLSAYAAQVHLEAPGNRIADYLIALSNIAMEEETRSRQAAHALLAHFERVAGERALLGEALLERTELHDAPDHFARLARTRDLAVIPIAPTLVAQQAAAQGAIFGSGRPVLLLPSEGAPLAATARRHAVVAWDGSRCAARALGDSIPLLRKADRVRILTVTGEKPLRDTPSAADVARHLRSHGIGAQEVRHEANKEAIGAILSAHVLEDQSGLLVMGAYGHSRLREFILGGATEHMLHSPPCPVLMSH